MSRLQRFREWYYENHEHNPKDDWWETGILFLVFPALFIAAVLIFGSVWGAIT